MLSADFYAAKTQMENAYNQLQELRAKIMQTYKIIGDPISKWSSSTSLPNEQEYPSADKIRGLLKEVNDAHKKVRELIKSNQNNEQAHRWYQGLPKWARWG